MTEQFDVVSKTFADEGTVYLIPHYLRCPTCDVKISIQGFTANDPVICFYEHAHPRKDFGKQFGIIKGVKSEKV